MYTVCFPVHLRGWDRDAVQSHAVLPGRPGYQSVSGLYQPGFLQLPLASTQRQNSALVVAPPAGSPSPPELGRPQLTLVSTA